MTLLDITNLTRDFALAGKLPWQSSRLRAVDDVSLSIAEGETVSLVGESGCGKSTIGRMVVGLMKPTAGGIAFQGRPTAAGRERARQIQIVFQDPFGSLNPQMTAGALIAEPAILHGLVPRRQAASRARELLAMVGLPADAAERYPHEFSGGQRQRIAIARALAAEPKLIVCDEAVSALDLSVQAQITNLLLDIQQKTGVSYLFISHGLSLVRHISDRVAVMYLGRLVEMGPVDEIFDAPRHPYTQALISAAPEPVPASRHSRMVLQGEVPSPLDLPRGCSFHTRCPHASDVCTSMVPALEPADNHATACHRWREITAAARQSTPVPPRVRAIIDLYRRASSTAGKAQA